MSRYKDCFLKIKLILSKFILKCTRKSRLRTSIMVLILFSSLGLAYGKIINWLDPNLYKEYIQDLILEHTGQTILLQGPVEIKYLPYPALEARKVIFKDKLISAESLKIYPNIKSFLSEQKFLELELLDIQYKFYHVPELYTYVTYEKGIIDLEETTCRLKKGKSEASFAIDSLRIDTNEKINKYWLKHKGPNFPLEFFLLLSGAKTKILEGDNTHIDIDLTAEGNDIIPIKKSLAGKIDIEIIHGHFYGTNLIDSLKKAKSLVGTLATKITQPLSFVLEKLSGRHASSGNETTPFSSLKIIGHLKNGHFVTPYVKAEHPIYSVQGKGKMNLETSKMNYHIEAIYKEKTPIQVTQKTTNDKNHSKNIILHSAPLVIEISGHFDKPRIETNFDSYLKFVKRATKNATSHSSHSRGHNNGK